MGTLRKLGLTGKIFALLSTNLTTTLGHFLPGGDNYGDIGVCWRLARQLAAEYGFRCVCGGLSWPLSTRFSRLSTRCLRADCLGVEVCRWTLEFPQVERGRVVEAFGCALPRATLPRCGAAGEAYETDETDETDETTKPTKSLWINLEY